MKKIQHDRLKIRNDRKGERGIALIVVLFVVATLSVLVLEFIQSTRINLYIASNIADGMKGIYLGKSGIYVAAGALLDDMQDNSNDHLQEDWAQPLPALPAGEGWVTVDITDESSKFNINTMVRKSGVVDTVKMEVFKKIMTNLELDPELANAIIDWVDEDDQAQNGGLEDAIYGYMSLADPYSSKNGKFLSLSELMLVNGITDEIFQKLKPYITIYGDNKLNINSVEQKVLKAYIQVLSREDEAASAQDVINWREEEGNYFKKKEIKNVLVNDIGLDPTVAKELTKYFQTTTRYFSVKSEAVVGESTKRCYGVIQRSKEDVKVIYFRPM